MRIWRTFTLRWFQRGLFIALAVAAVAPTGCRSTRSSLSNVPGMGWIGPRDDALSLGNWDESESALPKPAAEATPQVASRGSQGSTQPARKSYPLDPETSAMNRASEQKQDLAATNSEGVYPDTGYPPLNQAAAAGADQYADDTGPVGVQPQRGFYGQEPTDFEDELAGGPDAGKDLAGNLTQDAQRQYSRFSEVANDAADDLEQAAETVNDYAGRPPRRWADDDLAGAADRFSNAADQLDREATSRYSDAAAQVADTYDQAADQLDRSTDLASDDLEGFAGDVANTVTQDARGQFNNATHRWADQARDFGQQTKQQLSQSKQEAIDRVQQGLGSTYDSAQQALGQATKPLTNAYDRAADQTEGLLQRGRDALQGFGQRDEASAELGQDTLGNARDIAQQAARQLQQSADDLNAASPYNNVAPQTGDQSPRRLAKPWRPGSTSSYPTATEQTYRKTAPLNVAPASYTDSERTSDRRLTPSYR